MHSLDSEGYTGLTQGYAKPQPKTNQQMDQEMMQMLENEEIQEEIEKQKKLEKGLMEEGSQWLLQTMSSMPCPISPVREWQNCRKTPIY